MRVAVLGLYRSGSTAMAGALARLGIDMGAPFFRDYYESAALAAQLRAWWNEPRLEPAVDANARLQGLKRWIEEREGKTDRVVGAKHPLLSLCGDDLVAAWGQNARFLWTFRPFDDSVRSLERLNWWPDARRIQGVLWRSLHRFFESQHHLKIDFSELVGNPDITLRKVAEFLQLTPSDKTWNDAVNFIQSRPQPTTKANTTSAAWFQAAMQRHQSGEVSAAVAEYERILASDPGHSGAWHLLGVAQQQLGNTSLAIEHIERAIAIDPTKAIYHNNLAVALRTAGELPRAQMAAERAVALNPQYADAHSNLGLILQDLGRGTEANAAYAQALQLNPSHGDALYNSANLLHELGRHDDAIARYERVIKLQPQRAEVYNNLGNALLAEKKFEEAAASFQQTLRLKPEFAEAWLNLGQAQALLDQSDEAKLAFAKAAELRPDRVLWQWKSLSFCPTVFTSSAELGAYRTDLEARLDQCLTETRTAEVEHLDQDAFAPPFNLSHHGLCNRAIKEKYARLFRSLVPKVAPRRNTGKPRIGFVVTSGHEGGMLRGLSGLIERLPERYQVVVLGSETVVPRCRSHIKRADVECIGFANRLRGASEVIASAAIDLLYHWQIGSDTLNCLLPFAQLAPVQCTSWGTHVTSGIEEVQYYLSSELIETPESQQHFTERLIQLPTLPTFERRISQPPPRPPSYFNLPERGTLYLCPHRFAKLHPDFDALLLHILDRDKEGHVVLLRSDQGAVVDRLKHRFERNLGSHAARVLFLPSQQGEKYYQLIRAADMILDPPHYSSGLTAYDALAMHVPVVTLPGELHVSRYALGCYDKMGLKSLVPTTNKQYIDLALQLSSNLDFRKETVSQIAERHRVLFEDDVFVSTFANFLDGALTRK